MEDDEQDREVIECAYVHNGQQQTICDRCMEAIGEDKVTELKPWKIAA